MTQMTKAWVPALVIAMFTFPAQAETLSWEACVQEAWAQNADLRAARANLDASRYQALGAYSGYLPQVSASAGYTESRDGVTMGTTTGTTTPYSASISVTQNLFAGFQDQARVAQAAANYDVAEASLAATRARVNHDLRSAFAGLGYAQNNLDLTESIMRRLQENLRLVELRYEGGRENKGSYLLTKASLGQARFEHLQAKQALATARAELARALGRMPSDDLAVSGAVPAGEPQAQPDFARLVEQTPDYRQASAEEKAAAAGITLARAPLYPSLNLTGTRARDGEQWYPEDPRRTVGLTLSVPIFSGGKDYFATQSAAATHIAAETNKQVVDRQVLVKLKQAHAAFVESVEKLNVDRDFLEAAGTRAEIARAKYQNGLISFEDWDRIENDLILRQKTLLQSQRGRINAEAVWELTLGKGLMP
jgi:outer membrane protein TolC